MGKFLAISLVVYYLFGLIVLPNGNFAALPNLSQMYSHCKTMEDRVDFFTDHVINIDGMFDKHDHGDEQKPHEPLQNQQQVSSFVYCLFSHSFELKLQITNKDKPIIETTNFTPSEYITKLFRPPII